MPRLSGARGHTNGWSTSRPAANPALGFHQLCPLTQRANAPLHLEGHIRPGPRAYSFLFAVRPQTAAIKNHSSPEPIIPVIGTSSEPGSRVVFSFQFSIHISPKL